MYFSGESRGDFFSFVLFKYIPNFYKKHFVTKK